MVKPLLKKWLLPALTSQPVAAVARRLLPPAVPVFMLHRTADNRVVESDNYTQHLRRCLDYLRKQGYQLISLQQLIQAYPDLRQLPAKSVVFTMDDGYADQAEVIAPVFAEFDCPLTFFVITGLLDQTLWPWDAQVSWLLEQADPGAMAASSVVQQLGVTEHNHTDRVQLRRAVVTAMKSLPVSQLDAIIEQLAKAAQLELPQTPPPDYRAMSWDDARKLERQGIQFAPHSVSHRILSNMDTAGMQFQITESWRVIQSHLQSPLKLFCYPNGRAGDFGERDIAFLKNNGYLGAVSTVPDQVRYSPQIPDAIYRIPRLPLPDAFTDFVRYCSWVENARGLTA